MAGRLHDTPLATPLEADDEPWDCVDATVGLPGGPLLAWFTPNLERLDECASSASPVGSAFVHSDLSLDNLGVARRGVIVVDWDFASIGNADLDVATVSLEVIAGGRAPEELRLANQAAWAARLATWLLDGSAEHSEWVKDPAALRSERLRLAGPALRWWAEEAGVVPPPLPRGARRNE